VRMDVSVDVLGWLIIGYFVVYGIVMLLRR